MNNPVGAETLPVWIENAVPEFIRELTFVRFDHIRDDHGFSHWVRLCTSRELWRPNARWRKLMRISRESNPTRGISNIALSRNGIVMMIVNSVYCAAEKEYRRQAIPARKHNKANVAEKVREIVSMNRRHKHKPITIGKLLNFAFKLTAYEEYLMDEAESGTNNLQLQMEKVETELKIFQGMNAKVGSLRSHTVLMENEMIKRKWLP